jgi:hypothetical protein
VPLEDADARISEQRPLEGGAHASSSRRSAARWWSGISRYGGSRTGEEWRRPASAER